MKIVAIGGGTGQSTMLRGLKHCTEELTAIVSVSDDGGGSGLLRHDLGMLPPGDIRACVMALANTEPMMAKLLQYRFNGGQNTLTGQCFGNLFLAALNGICDNFNDAVSLMCEVLAITGRVLPVTNADVHLMAKFANGQAVLGESKILAAKKAANCKIVAVDLVPSRPKALPQVIDAIMDADMIVLGPGSLYTSIIPNLLVDGVADAISRSKAKTVFVLNLMTQEGETEDYSAYDHLQALYDHSCEGLVDVCLANNGILSSTLTAQYSAENAMLLQLDRDKFNGVTLIETDLLADHDEMVRHDPGKLAAAIMAIAAD